MTKSCKHNRCFSCNKATFLVLFVLIFVFFVLTSLAGVFTIHFCMIWHVLFLIPNNYMKWTMQWVYTVKCFCMYETVQCSFWSSVRLLLLIVDYRLCVCKPIHHIQYSISIILPYIHQHAYFIGCCTTWTIDTINQLKNLAPFVKFLKLLINFMVDALCVILVRATAQLHMSELKDALILSSIRWSQSDIHLFIQSAKCTLIKYGNWS